MALLAGVAALYLLLTWKPSSYRPPHLDQAQKEIATQQFFAHVAEMDTPNDTDDPYSWELSEQSANEYLAAMDEIAFQRPNARNRPRLRGDVQAAMDRAGLAQPVARFNDGRMTIMVRSTEYAAIVSADLSFTFVNEDKVLVNLDGARVGLLPVPRFAVRDGLKRFKAVLQSRLERMQSPATDDSSGGIPLVNLAEVFATIIAAIDSEPLPTRIKILHCQVQEITIQDGLLRLMVRPLREDDYD